MLAVLNIGSSSAKFALFAAPESALARGQIFPHPDDSACNLECKIAGEKETAQWPAPNGEWQSGFFQWAEARFPQNKLRAVGHRVVHGGESFRAPAVLDAKALDILDSIAPLAPLHLPPAIRAVRQTAKARPQLVQVGCFDTAFHAAIPQERRKFALPREFAEEGILRYGFHGLSYENIAEQAPQAFGEKIAGGKIVALHLGNGASGCAMQGGKSRATTMGMTALDGLVMGTRCGALDPGVVLHLIRARGISPEDTEEILTRKSGLLGLSGVSADMRELHKSQEPDAKFALTVFCESAARNAAALACDIGGMDALAFTGGIGENNPDIRRDICAKLEFLGVKIDSRANDSGQPDIAAKESRVAAAVIPADEERVIARHVFHLLAARKAGEI